jgi:hypothetical protein
LRPFPPVAFRYDGLAVWTSDNRRQILGQTAGNVKAVGGDPAAETALLESVVDPNVRFARTASEVPLVNNLVSRGSVFEYVNERGIPIVSGGTPPATDADLLKILPGVLDFVLRWDGPANLDLTVGVLSGVGEALYPATGANTSPSGGVIPFNNIGGPKGGIELAYWGSNYPKALYPVGVTSVSGATVDWRIDVFLNGSRVNIINEATGTQVTTLSGQISPGQQMGGVAEVGEVIPVGPPGPPPGPSSILSSARLAQSNGVVPRNHR